MDRYSPLAAHSPLRIQMVSSLPVLNSIPRKGITEHHNSEIWIVAPPSQLFEIALVLVRLDQLASRIVNSQGVRLAVLFLRGNVYYDNRMRPCRSNRQINSIGKLLLDMSNSECSKTQTIN